MLGSFRDPTLSGLEELPLLTPETGLFAAEGKNMTVERKLLVPQREE